MPREDIRERLSGARADDRATGGVAVLMPMVWSIRNVVYSGALERLASRVGPVRLVMRERPDEDGALAGGFSPAASYEPLIRPRSTPARGKPLVDAIVRSAFSRRNRITSYDIYRHWFGRDNGPKLRVRSALIELLGAASRGRLQFDSLCRFSESLYRRSHDLSAIREQLERMRPDLLWSTVCVSPQEYPYILVAHDLGIPVVTSVLSFDNLTSRGWLPHFDHYLVWNEVMRDQLLRFYPYLSAEQVSVTGTGQFDFHRRPECLWHRDRTTDRLGIPRGARYFLYSTSHISLAPDEPELLELFARMLRADEALSESWLVVRLHPLDDGARWKELANGCERVRIEHAWEDLPDAEGWTFSSLEDQARLVSTIAHADACVNVASTMSLDAAILDRPVVNIEFSGESDSPAGLLYAEYDADHYRPLIDSGGIRLAHTWPELASHLREAVRHPERYRSERAAMVRRECGVVDGRAAERVADAVAALHAARAGGRDAATIASPSARESPLASAGHPV